MFWDPSCAEVRFHASPDKKTPPSMSAAAQVEQEKGRGTTEAIDDGRYSGAAGVFESIDTEGSKC